MKNRTEREILAELLTKVRRRLFFKTAFHGLMLSALAGLPFAAAVVAADHRWNQGRVSLIVLLAAFGGALILAALLGLRGLGERVRSALTLDERAHLKDRVSSAWEFLGQSTLSEAHLAQIRDAIRHAESLNYRKVLRLEWPRFAAALPAMALLLALSFLVPALAPAKANLIARDALRDAQLQQLEELKQELAAKQDLPKELEEALKKLEDIRKQFEKGEISERDLMLQLGRLDENLRAKAAEPGVEKLEAEMNTIIPHLSANPATLEAAKAMKEKQFDKAAQELKNLADKIAETKPQDQKKLATQLGAAAAKLGKKKSGDSFGGELAQASESLDKSDSEGFKSACKGMCDKLGLLKKCNGLKSVCNKIGLCKASLGQCENKELGYKLGPQTLAKSQGGLKAGTSTAGDPLAEPNRLADSYKKMLQITGQAGHGPTETETESTSGQLSQSQLQAKELHANYAAAAEEVIEREDIPLSHRYHVKRYFQAIQPKD